MGGAHSGDRRGCYRDHVSSSSSKAMFSIMVVSKTDKIEWRLCRIGVIKCDGGDTEAANIDLVGTV